MKTPSFFQRSELHAALWAFRREFTVCLIFTLVVNLLMLTPTLYMLQVFDRVMLSQSELTLTVLTLVMLYLFAMLAFSEWARSRLLVRVGVKLDEHLNSRVFNASFESRLKQLNRNPSQAFSDLATVRQFLTGKGLFAFLDAPWSPIYIALVFLMHPMLGWLSIFFSLFLVVIAYISHRLTSGHIENAQEASTHAFTYVNSKLKNSEVVESMGMLGDLRRRWEERHQKHLSLEHRAQDISHRMQCSTKFFRYTQQSLTLGAGALLVIRGDLTVGAMIAGNVLMGRATAPIDQMVSAWKSTLSAKEAFKRLAQLLVEQPERSDGHLHEAPTGYIRTEDLVATAPGRQNPILKGLNTQFQAGQVTVIIGPSGSGKSTFARALVGIWPYVTGKVLYDNENIDTWNRVDLGPFIGYLPQDIELFEGSIAENIARFGNIDSEKIIIAAKRCGVHDMILRLPRGYDTSMGEAGSLLSGGQRQRIGLARAMYGDPAVVILDEPNSNLDDIGETALVRSVEDLKGQGTTVILITHRSSIIGVADRLLVLADGTIQHDGPRDQIIAALQAPRPRAPGGETPSLQPA